MSFSYLLLCFWDQPKCDVRVLASMKQLKLCPESELLISLFGNVNPPYEDDNMLSQVDCGKRINAIEMEEWPSKQSNLKAACCKFHLYIDSS